MYAEGNLRTAIRKFLETEINEGRLTVTDKDKVRVMEYSPFSEDDPIDAFRRYYGEAALDSADKMASKLQMGESFSDYERIFRENMPELKIKTEGAGQYDQSIADAEAALKQGAEDKKNLEILEDFDVEGRTKNNMGGIISSRVGYRDAGRVIRLAQLLRSKGKDLTEEIRKAVDNIFPSGDRKVDADMALDDMYEELGIDRDMVDMKDDMKAYGEAYDLLSLPPGSRGGPDDIAAPFSSEKVELPEGVKAEDTILPTGNLISKKLKTMRIANEIEPGLFENLTDTQMEIIDKYGELIDRDLLKNIVLDPDPNNQAAALATLEEAMVLMKKGVGPDEAIDILKKGSRTEQAEGRSKLFNGDVMKIAEYNDMMSYLTRQNFSSGTNKPRTVSELIKSKDIVTGDKYKPKNPKLIQSIRAFEEKYGFRKKESDGGPQIIPHQNQQKIH